jgi:hypothetical protein
VSGPRFDRPISRDEERFWASATARWTLGILALVLICGGIVWAASVGTSDVKGRGDVHKANNSAINRIQQQANFVQTKADYEGALAKIKVARSSLAAANKANDKKAISQRQVELDGLVQNCIDTAQQYNADSGKITAKDWKDSGMPETLDPSKCNEETTS